VRRTTTVRRRRRRRRKRRRRRGKERRDFAGCGRASGKGWWMTMISYVR